MSKYRATWHKKDLMEFALSHTVRYRDPLNKKRFAVPYKDAAKAKEKMAQLKRDGVKEIEITKDILRGKFKEEFIKEDGHMDVSSSKRMAGVIAEDAKLIMQELGKKSEDESLPTWWTNKLAVSAHNMNAARDYITDDIKEDLDEAMSSDNIKKLKDTWADIKLMSPEKVKTLKNFLDKYSTDTLVQLSQAGINFVSNMARSVAMKRKAGDPKHAGSMKEETTPQQRVSDMQQRIRDKEDRISKMDIGDPKTKTPMAIAKSDLNTMKMKLDDLRKKADAARLTAEKEPETGKKEIKEEDLSEKIKGIQTKSEKSGIPYGILKQVYNRGMAAWKGGHRPGTTPQQWAFARVNSFITKGKSYYTADADLAKKARASKKKK